MQVRTSEQELEPQRIEPELGPELEPERLLAREPRRTEQVEAGRRELKRKEL